MEARALSGIEDGCLSWLCSWPIVPSWPNMRTQSNVLAQAPEFQAFLASQASKNKHLCLHMARSQRGAHFLAPCTVTETLILHRMYGIISMPSDVFSPTEGTHLVQNTEQGLGVGVDQWGKCSLCIHGDLNLSP